MKQKLSSSLKNINFKLFLALLVLGLCPTVYTTVRVFFLGQLPGDWSFSIAGQLSWVNLLYEVVSEAIILPLFYFVGKVKQNRAAFSNRVRTGMLVSLGAYLVLSAAILLFAEPLLRLMAADESILDAEGRIDLSKLQPVIYDSAQNSYRVVGGKVGDAWGSGKSIQERQVQ